MSDRNLDIARRVREGQSRSEVAEIYGISRKTVGDICRQQGVRTNRITAEKVREVVRLRGNGLGTKAIAERMEISASQVYRVLKKRGMQGPPVNRAYETPARKRAVALVAKGKSYKQVAKATGLTRNVVAGLVWRAKRRQEKKDE